MASRLGRAGSSGLVLFPSLWAGGFPGGPGGTGAAAVAVERESGLGVGDKLQWGDQAWRVASPATVSDQASLKSRHGLLVLMPA